MSQAIYLGQEERWPSRGKVSPPKPVSQAEFPTAGEAPDLESAGAAAFSKCHRLSLETGRSSVRCPRPLRPVLWGPRPRLPHSHPQSGLGAPRKTKDPRLSHCCIGGRRLRPAGGSGM